MAKKPKEEKKRPRTISRRLLRWAVAILCLIALSWVAAWMVQRSLRSSANKRAMQSWFDDTLNADVSLLGDMVVRVNLLRDSRLLFHNVEVEHPNPVFPGKFATIRRMGAWNPPWSIFRLWPGKMDLAFQEMNVLLEENDAGEWSTDGLMRPLASVDAPFPYLVPKISEWQATLENSSLKIRRRGYELELGIAAEVQGRSGSGLLAARLDKLPFSFGRVDAEKRLSGVAGPVRAAFSFGGRQGALAMPVAGRTELRGEGLPLAMLPFFLTGIPLENASGTFNGQIAYREHPDAAGALILEGELRDAPLSLFGLPRNAPLRLTWPVSPRRSDLKASLHMGPSGFGAFEMVVPMDSAGNPKLLSMRGEVAALDDIPELLDQHERWIDWLSRAFPSVEWRTGKWRGFGWSGENMRLALTRATAGLHLTGEAELLGGRARLAMTSGQGETPINVSMERIDAGLTAAGMSRLLPEPFRVKLSGSHVNLTWRGVRAGGAIGSWGAGLVFAKPEIDVAASGEWWKVLSEAVKTIAGALPEWGGGDADELLDLAAGEKIPLDQLSIVSEKSSAGKLEVEFRAYGDVFGQATGMIEAGADGVVEGAFVLAGPSQVIAAVERVNPDFALVLALLASDSPGLRIQFRMEPGGKPEFTFPFLDDAKEVLRDLTRDKVPE